MKIDKVIYLIVIFLLYWISFEWFLLSFIDDYQTIRYIRMIVDAIPTLTLILYFSWYPLKQSNIAVDISFAYLLIFLIAFLSIIIDGGKASSIIANLGVVIRFVPLVFITRLRNKESFSNFFTHIIIVSIAHIILTTFQLLNNDLFFKLFLPDRGIFVEMMPTSYYEDAINSTFINTLDFAYLILGLSVIMLFKLQSDITRWFVFAVSFILLVLTKSMASVLGLVLVGLFISKRRIIYLSIFLIPALSILLLNENILMKLVGTTSLLDWLENSAYYARVGFFTKLLPQFFSSNLKDIFLGMGIDEGLVNSKLIGYSDVPLILTYGDNNLKLLKDVYWISILMTQGVLSFLLTIYILRRIYVFSTGENFESTRILKTFIILVVMLGFLNQILDQKGFSFLFWIIVSFKVNEMSYYR